MKRLSPIARQISTEALSAELAAERGDWQALQASYEHLALLFAEFRLIYVKALARSRGPAPEALFKAVRCRPQRPSRRDGCER